MTVSVSPDAYDVYLDGNQISTLYDRNNNQSEILRQLFSDDSSVLKEFTNNAIGRSVYSADNDLKAKIDEFRFYNTALTKKQAKSAYESYAVSEELLTQLEEAVNRTKSKHVSFYTRESYDILEEALTAAQAGLGNPVTDANVTRLIENLEKAESALQGENQDEVDAALICLRKTMELQEEKNLC